MWSVVVALVWGSGSLASDFSKQKQAGYFEGSLRYVVSLYSPQTGKAVERSSVDLLATEDRLCVPSFDLTGVFTHKVLLGVTSVLLRHDVDDFILYGDESDAYRIHGYDKMLLGLALRALAFSETSIDMAPPRKSGPYALRNFRANLRRYGSDSDFRYDLYFTNDYKVNWGSLADSWLFGSRGLDVPELDTALERSEVPVRIEVYHTGGKLFSVNLMEAKEHPVSPLSMAIPAQKVVHSSTSLIKLLAAEAMGW